MVFVACGLNHKTAPINVREKVALAPATQDSLLQKFSRKAFDAALKVTEEQPGFPEPYFVLVKSGTELNRDVEPYLQKYVSLCKAVTIRERKRYSLEPRLCLNLKEAEDELAKKSTEL